MLEPGEAPDVGRLVDHGLNAERSPFLEVLLDAAVLVGEVHLHLGAGTEDAGAELVGGGATTPVPAEHGVHLVGSADADVVGDQSFKEAAGPTRVVEDHRAGHLGLAHRQLPPIPAGPIAVTQRGRDDRHPPGEECLDVSGAEPITDRLQPGWVVAGPEPVGQFGEPDARSRGLLLDPLVAVQPHLGRIVRIGPGRSVVLSDGLFPRPALPNRTCVFPRIRLSTSPTRSAMRRLPPLGSTASGSARPDSGSG